MVIDKRSVLAIIYQKSKIRFAKTIGERGLCPGVEQKCFNKKRLNFLFEHFSFHLYRSQTWDTGLLEGVIHKQPSGLYTGYNLCPNFQLQVFNAGFLAMFSIYTFVIYLSVRSVDD